MSALEKVEHTPPPPASPRSVGLTFAVVSLIVAFFLRNQASIAIALVGVALGLGVISYAAPNLLKGPALLWSRFALLLGVIVNPVVMAIIFYGFITPYGLLLRLAGRDPLRIYGKKRPESYWVKVGDQQEQPSMERQF